MSFTFLIPKSHRSSSEGPRIGWRSASTLSFGSLSLRRPETGFSPPVDVYETETEVVVRMEIAGIDPTTIDIMIMLAITTPIPILNTFLFCIQNHKYLLFRIQNNK